MNRPIVRTMRPGSSCQVWLIELGAWLRWVERNVAGFGGVRAKVRVLFLSVCGQCVLGLMGSPCSRCVLRYAISKCLGFFPFLEVAGC